MHGWQASALLFSMPAYDADTAAIDSGGQKRMAPDHLQAVGQQGKSYHGIVGQGEGQEGQGEGRGSREGKGTGRGKGPRTRTWSGRPRPGGC